MTTYSGYLPSGTNLYAGDVLTSPDGLYYGVLDTTGAAGFGKGLFVIAPGSSPTIAPLQSCADCAVPVSNTPTENLGGFFAQLGMNGAFNVYSSASGRDQGTVALVSAGDTGQSPAVPPYYAAIQGQLNKSTGNHGGTFVIYQESYPNTSNPLVTSGSNIIGDVTGIKLSGGASGTGIDYDFAHATLLSVQNVASEPATNMNSTSQPQQFNDNLSLSYTDSQSFSFQVSDATATSIGSSVNVGVPGVAGASFSFGITSTTTISNGQSTTTSNSTTFQVGVRPTVPPGYTYEAFLTGADAKFLVPFTWTGTATYAGGATAAVTGRGVFGGDETGMFNAAVYCVAAPFGSDCPSIPISSEAVAPVPEPATAMLLPLVLLGVIVARRSRRGST